MNELMMRMMMQMFSNASGGQQQNTQQQDTQGNLANNLLSSAAPALGTVATKLASGEKFNVGDIGSVLQGASPALNMIPGVGTIASAGTNILGSVLQGLGNKQEEFKPGQVIPQVSNPYMCGGKLKSYQFGGPMKQYNAPPHSMGGQAVDANGNPTMNPQQGAAEIEKQEMYSSAGPGDGFVFSDAIRLPNGMTLAQKAAEIEKKFGKFKDAISMATKERELKKLAEYGEAMKKQMEEQAAQQQMQDSQRMQIGAPTNEEIQQRQMMQQQQGQMQQGMPQQQMQQGQMPMMQFGGVMQEPPVKTQRAQVNQDIDDYLNKAVLEEDTLLENVAETFDPTGVSSYDDAHKAYQSWIGRGKGNMGPLKNFPQTLPTLSEMSDLAAAIPVVGNATKIARLFGKGLDVLSNANNAINIAKDPTNLNNSTSFLGSILPKKQYGGKLKASNGLVSGGDPFGISSVYARKRDAQAGNNPNAIANVYQQIRNAQANANYTPLFNPLALTLQDALSLNNPVTTSSNNNNNNNSSSSNNNNNNSSSRNSSRSNNNNNNSNNNNNNNNPQQNPSSNTTTANSTTTLPNKYDPLYSTFDPLYQQDFYKNRGVDYTIPFDPYSRITSPDALVSLISSNQARSALGQSGGANTAANVARLAGTGTQDPLLNSNAVGYQPGVTLKSQFGGAPLGAKTLPSLPSSKSKKSKTKEEEEKLKLGALNKAALALKGAGILGAGIDAFQKPEVVDPRLPNFAAQDQYFSETGIDPQLMLNQANLQKNAAMQAASQGAGSYGQFLNRANAIMRGTQDAQSQALLSAQQYNDQMSMARGARGDRNAGITSQMQQQADVLNAQNRAAQANARGNLYSLATQAGTTLSQLQYAQDAMKNQNELARLTNQELAAALSTMYPDMKDAFDKIINMTPEERKKFNEMLLGVTQ